LSTLAYVIVSLEKSEKEELQNGRIKNSSAIIISKTLNNC